MFRPIPSRGRVPAVRRPVFVVRRPGGGLGIVPMSAVTQVMSETTCQGPDGEFVICPSSRLSQTVDSTCFNGAGPDGSTCLKPLFPWFGQHKNCKCVGVVDVPAPWDMVATVAVIGAIGFRLLRGFSR